MNDKDFDKIFGDRLREERKFKEDENEWQRLAGRLDAFIGGNSSKIEGNRNTFRRWLLPLIALLLLLTTGGLFGKLNQLDKKNNALSEQMQTIKSQLITQHDTVIIRKTDTIYITQNAAQTTSKPRISESKTSDFKGVKNTSYASSKNGDLDNNANQFTTANANAQQRVSSREKALESKVLQLENKLQTSENQRLASDARLAELEEKMNKKPLETAIVETGFVNQTAEKSTNKVEKLEALIVSKDSLIAKLTAQKATDSTTTIAKLKENGLLEEKKGSLSIEAQKTIKTVKKSPNSRLFAGISGGSIYYQTAWKNGQNIEIFRNEKSYQLGLKLEYALTDQLRLTAGGDYCPFEFQIFWQDNRYNMPTTTIQTGEKLKSTKALQKLTQGFIGAKYVFTDGKKRLNPYLGAAYTAMRILPFQVDYEIQNTASGVIHIQKETSDGANIANLLLLNSGLEYRFNRRFVVQGEAFYNLDMNRPQKTYDLFGLRGTFLVNF
jgi:hypothetical protein